TRAQRLDHDHEDALHEIARTILVAEVLETVEPDARRELATELGLVHAAPSVLDAECICEPAQQRRAVSAIRAAVHERERRRFGARERLDDRARVAFDAPSAHRAHDLL